MRAGAPEDIEVDMERLTRSNIPRAMRSGKVNRLSRGN